VSLSLISCAQFNDRPLQPNESALYIEARTLSSTGLREFIESEAGRKTAWPFKTWDIDRLTLAAIYYHPDLALVRAQADSADAAIITAAQRPNPSLSISPTWIRNVATAAVPWIAASAISIPIETAGKRGFRIAKAEHLTVAARLRIADTAWLLRGRLRLAMLEVYAAQEIERLLQQQLSFQRTMTDKLEQQLLAGEISRFEITRSRLALNQLQLNVSAARKRGAESRVQLATAIGLPVEALTGIELNFTPLSKPPDLDSIPVQRLKDIALRERPDLLAALADYDAAQSALQLEITNQVPNIQANPGYAWEMGEHRWTLGATMQLPVLHQNQGPIAEAEAKRRELAVRFEALQIRILGDIDRAYTSFAAVLVKWRDAKMQTRLQQDSLHSVQALFKVGEIDALALLGAEMESAVTERARLDVLIETQQALNGLEDSLRYPLASKLSASLISDTAIRKIPQ
jgi:outer membrane protein TolC